MKFSDYEERAFKFAKYPNVGNNLPYSGLGLAGEAGELQEKVLGLSAQININACKIADKIKKIIRDSGEIVPEAVKLEILKEGGDLMWYLSDLARTLGSSLTEIAEINIQKLEGRNARGTLQGSGDDR